MKLLTSFYDAYHQKNQRYFKIIGENNFTYFYILEFFTLALKKPFARYQALDVGCGVGTLSLYLANRGMRVMGIDISERAIAIANQAQKSTGVKRATFKQGQLQSGTGKYDVIICFEVIEHIANQIAFLKKIHSHLSPHGQLLLSTPSQDNWLYRHGWYDHFDQEVGHLRRYTEKELKQLLTEQGFQVKLIRSVEGPLRNLLFIWHLDFIIKCIRGPLVPAFHWLDHLSAQIWGAADIQVLATKK